MVKHRISKTIAVSWIATLLLSFAASGSEVTPGQPRKGWSFEDAAHIPIQSGGRLKPLDSYARETILLFTGSRSYPGWNPVDFLLSLISEPLVWSERKIIRTTHPEVKRQLLLDEKRSFYSPQELFHNNVLMQYLQTIKSLSSQEKTSRKTSRESELFKLGNAIMTFRSIVSGSALTVIPSKDSQSWRNVIESKEDREFLDLHRTIAGMLRAYISGDQSEFEQNAKLSRQKLTEFLPTDQGSAKQISAEVAYNQYRPFLIAWIFYLLSTVSWLLFRNQFPILFKASIWIGFFAHLMGLILRIYISGRPPVTNMYESIVWVSFGTIIFSFILYFLQKNSLVLAVAGAVGAFCLIAGDAAPAIMDPNIHPLVPVLRSNLWLTVHVLTITLGYAAFALTLGLGNISLYHYLLRTFKKDRGRLKKIEEANLLCYRAMQFGVVLLAAGTILGGVWADYSWGRFWGWDPKEVWALIALLAYLAILHGRFTGWVSQFGFSAWTVIGFLTVLMAWYGVNFVLGAGLHAYGFAHGGGFWVGAFVIVQLAFVGFVAFRNKELMKSQNLKKGS